jgi:hypothetical protein
MRVQTKSTTLRNYRGTFISERRTKMTRTTSDDGADVQNWNSAGTGDLTFGSNFQVSEQKTWFQNR